MWRKRVSCRFRKKISLSQRHWCEWERGEREWKGERGTERDSRSEWERKVREEREWQQAWVREERAYKSSSGHRPTSDVSPQLFVTVSVSSEPEKTQTLPRCVTRTPLLLSSTMDPECARPVSPVMTLPGLSSPPSLDARATRWWALEVGANLSHQVLT